jgi:hypothetical protein
MKKLVHAKDIEELSGAVTVKQMKHYQKEEEGFSEVSLVNRLQCH